MTEREGVPQELRFFKPETFEIMAGLVHMNGSFPIDEGNFAKGLKVAVVKAPFLGVFIDEKTGELTQAAKSALGTLEAGGLISRIDGEWIVQDNGNSLNNPKEKLRSRVENIFNQKGITVLGEAAGVAREVWSVQKSK